MQIKTRLIVIGVIKQGDANLIVRCYTEAFGYQSFIVKGAFSRRVSGSQRAYFQPLALLEAVVQHRPKAALQYFKEVDFLSDHPPQQGDIKKQTLLLFLAEVLHQVLQEEGESNPKLFEFLLTAISWMALHDKVGNFHLKFLIALTKYIGFYPNTATANEEAPYFDLETASFQMEKPEGFYLHGIALQHFKKLLGTNFDNIHTLQIQKTEKYQVLEFLLRYYQVHLQRFETPKSISVFQQIFAS